MRLVVAVTAVACAARASSAGAIVEAEPAAGASSTASVGAEPAADSTAKAEPDPSAEPPPSADRDCERTYGEMTFGLGASKHLSGDIVQGEMVLLNRAALGRAVRWGCEAGLEARVGLFADLASGDHANSSFIGLGLEGELNWHIAGDKRLGVRLSLEHHWIGRSAVSDGSTLIPTVGLRLRIDDSFSFGADTYYLHYNSDVWGRSSGVGAMATLGIEGVRATGVNMVVLAVGLVYALFLSTV